jgi:type I restriction enzyme S subunit
MSALPQNWVSATIEELVGARGLATDGDWIETKDQDPRGEVRLIQLADIGDGAFRDRSARFVTLDTARRLNCTFLEDGDVLIARMPDPLGRACIFPRLNRKAITAVDVFVWRGSDGRVDRRWLMHFINSPESRSAIAEQAGGTTRQRIAGGRLKALKLPVPPRGEQRRIVAKIDSVSAKSKRARDRLDHVPRLVERYKLAVSSVALDGSLTEVWRSEQGITGEWKHTTVGQVADVRLGKMLDKEKNKGTDTPYLRNVNVRWRGFDLSDLASMRMNDRERAELDIRDGDLFVCEGGEPGRAALWNRGRMNLSFQKALLRVRVGSEIDPRFLLAVLEHAAGSGGLEAHFTGTTIKHLPRVALCAIPLRLPTMKEQVEIVHRIETAFAWIDRLSREAQSARKLIDRLDQAILSKAFRGELVPQDPNDEPASVLLERIRAEGNGQTSGRKRRARAAG